MQTLGQIPPPELARRLGTGLALATGPFRFTLQSTEPGVARGLAALYADFLAEPAPGPAQEPADFTVSVRRPAGLRHWVRPQVTFFADERPPFKPLPAAQAFPLLEWGMNWCIASQSHHVLLVHAAVLERNGRCVALPGEPGAGKSTLTAALALSGWRLLTDEMMVVDLHALTLHGLARPISLKNRSIDVIRERFPDAVFGETARDTHKGTVCHVRPPAASVRDVDRPGRLAHVVFPRWKAGAATQLDAKGRAAAFLALAGHSFNYSLLGRAGFEAVGGLVEAAECWDFAYSELDEALRVFDDLVR